MRERCYRTCLQYGRRWEIGEEREVSSFTEDGQPIATTHFRLVEGSEPPADDSKLVTTPVRKAEESLDALRGDRVFAIRKALESLDPETNADWAVKGAPSLQRIHVLTGLEVQRGDVVEAWPEFDREFARSLRT